MLPIRTRACAFYQELARARAFTQGIMNVRTKGFCSALLRCGEIKLIAEKREYAISDLIANIARTKRRRTKSFGTQSSFTL